MGKMVHFGEGHPENIEHRNDSIPALGFVFGMALLAMLLFAVMVIGLVTTP